MKERERDLVAVDLLSLFFSGFYQKIMIIRNSKTSDVDGEIGRWIEHNEYFGDLLSGCNRMDRCFEETLFEIHDKAMPSERGMTITSVQFKIKIQLIYLCCI